MLSESYTSVSRLINTDPSELLCLWLSEPIASESAISSKKKLGSQVVLRPTCENGAQDASCK